MIDGEHAKRIVEAVTGELKTGTDRHVAILGAAFIEFALDASIATRFASRKDLHSRVFKSSREKWSFSTKIYLATLLVIFDRTDEGDVNLIREIRNRFAHGLFGDLHPTKLIVLDFCTPNIEALIASLNCVKRFATVDPPPELGFDFATSRGRFQFAVYYLVARILETYLKQDNMA
jgi:hypothetical protein